MNSVSVRYDVSEVRRRIRRGMAAWGVKPALTLEAWARKHFYLSAESSYVEQEWTPWAFQRGIMACIGNDDIREVDLKKSARVGYSKILVAAIGYYAEHKRRNQALWQPTDDDAKDFMESEVDPMLRDVKVMKTVAINHKSRHRDSTQKKKSFIGSSLRVRGGKSAKSYRRISVDVAYLDEGDAFDRDIEKEGSPRSLARKRLEGATFPKFVCGSTPKERGFSLIDDACEAADVRMTYQIPCPHCDVFQAITWGGKDVPHGFKWSPGKPETVQHLCAGCGALFNQTAYLNNADRGLWISEDGNTRLDADGNFSDAQGGALTPPEHVAFHVWTAYSPKVEWSEIVSEFIAASDAMKTGDETKMKAWVNTTKGESWQGDLETTDADELRQRAEPFPLRRMPRGCLLLLCGGDTQDNRIEFGVWGLGLGGETWSIDHQVFYGNPALSHVWDEAEAFLRTATYAHDCGPSQSIYATAIDSGGHHANGVYAFAHRLRSLRVHAIKGASGREHSIEQGNKKVGFTWNGRQERNGPMLWHVGTNLAKDRFQSRLDVRTPGPGYVHLSRDCSDEWFAQLASEDRHTRRMAWGSETRWVPNRPRNEVKDCLAYATWLEERLGLWRPGKAKFWEKLEAEVQPLGDLFAAASGFGAEASRETSPPPDDSPIIEGASRETSGHEPSAVWPKQPAASRETPASSAPIASDRWSRRL